MCLFTGVSDGYSSVRILPAKGSLDGKALGVRFNIEVSRSASFRSTGITVASILGYIGNESCVPDGLPVLLRVKATVEIKD